MLPATAWQAGLHVPFLLGLLVHSPDIIRFNTLVKAMDVTAGMDGYPALDLILYQLGKLGITLFD